MYLMKDLSFLNELGKDFFDKIMRWLNTSAGFFENALDESKRQAKRETSVYFLSVLKLDRLDNCSWIDIIDRLSPCFGVFSTAFQIQLWC